MNHTLRVNKALCLVLLLLVVASGIVSGFCTHRSCSPLCARDGAWWYVGGSGLGNYTRIQAAIDDASNGDTVYVYAASSPYYENVIVNKSINLMGEDKNTTIINGKRIDDSIWIKASFVNLYHLIILY